ncbi:MAG TPA: MBL fold metallo-hydrolase [Aggregatilineales bacterium]|jgi:glyoxylase-like metal-dependent hydrolase (beta-lactamase superfamily II)|nr:MBL fold metallo-hydrolase [Aggregatilineales bacterium]
MTVKVRMLPALGLAATNCYIIGDDATGEALLIDPVENAPALLQAVEAEGWTLKLILATHGHFDHVLASAQLKELSGAPFYINERDQFLLDALPETGLRFTGQRFPQAAVPDRYLTDASETLTLGDITLETLFTPGHAPGHISYFWREASLLFSGDCLFEGSIGRTDLPGSDHETLMRSITDVLLPLGDEVQVLPGHGDFTTLGQERQTNPFIRSYLADRE